jgi:hypothetical protein
MYTLFQSGSACEQNIAALGPCHGVAVAHGVIPVRQNCKNKTGKRKRRNGKMVK